MRIAVATTSGESVDKHFGHAEQFLIYDYNQGDPVKVQQVHVEKYCSFDPNHPFRQNQFDAIVQALEGCRAVVTAQIGDLPRQELLKVGLTHVDASGSVKEALHLAHRTICGCSAKGEKNAGCRQN